MKEHNKEILIGLKKAKSLLDKVVDMTEDGKYCIDILQQNLAAIGLLKSVNQKLMERHLNTCFKAVMSSSNKKEQQRMIAEILQINKITGK